MNATPERLLSLAGWLIAGVLVAIWYFQPPPKPEPVGLSLNEQSKLIADTVRLVAQVDSLEKELVKVKVKESASQKSYNKAVAVYKQTIARLEKDSMVIVIRQNEPKVDSLLTAKDSVITKSEDRIADCQNAFRVANEVNEGVKKRLDEQLSVTQGLLADEQVKRFKAEGENKKLRRKLLGTKIVSVLVVGAIVVLSL